MILNVYWNIDKAEELENPFGRDFNDLPLGRMAMKIQKDVEMIYKSQKQGISVQQLDPKDECWKSNQFWLTKDKEEEEKR